MKIKKGDNVIVIAGKDKGKIGEVSRALPKTEHVIIKDVNIVTRHQKNRQARSQGQIIQKSAPIHISNVALVENKKPVRAGFTVQKTEKSSKKTRISRASGKSI